MKRVLCYGDSNTYGGYDFGGVESKRFVNRWTIELQRLLGDGYLVIEEGNNGRAIASGTQEDRAVDSFVPIAISHEPLDIVVVMLGTNELWKGFNHTMAEIAAMLEEQVIKTLKELAKNIIIISPPRIESENLSKFFKNLFAKDAGEKSKQFSVSYKEVAKRNGCCLVDAFDVSLWQDGLHLDEQGHKQLAIRVYETIKKGR